jgi:hypothetical protein
MPTVASRAALAIVSIALAACFDDGVVGKADVALACDPACEADEICDPMLARCVECADDDDACEMPDECDDCASGDAACIAMYCQSCAVDGDCTGEESLCIDGLCQETEDGIGGLAGDAGR